MNTRSCAVLQSNFSGQFRAGDFLDFVCFPTPKNPAGRRNTVPFIPCRGSAPPPAKQEPAWGLPGQMRAGHQFVPGAPLPASPAGIPLPGSPGTNRKRKDYSFMFRQRIPAPHRARAPSTGSASRPARVAGTEGDSVGRIAGRVVPAGIGFKETSTVAICS